MPLYKITERRLKRKERDEQEGLTEIRAALQEEMGETDEDESESSGSDESKSESGEDAADEDDSDDEIDGEDDEDEHEDEDGSEDGSQGGSDDGDEDEDEDEDDGASSSSSSSAYSSLGRKLFPPLLGPAPLSASSALTSPLYTAREAGHTFRACVICPGKMLDTEQVQADHLASSVHRRRLARYTAHLTSHPADTMRDPRDLIPEIFSSERTSANTSAIASAKVNAKGKGKGKGKGKAAERSEGVSDERATAKRKRVDGAVDRGASGSMVAAGDKGDNAKVGRKAKAGARGEADRDAVPLPNDNGEHVVLEPVGKKKGPISVGGSRKSAKAVRLDKVQAKRGGDAGGASTSGADGAGVKLNRKQRRALARGVTAGGEGPGGEAVPAS